MNALELCERYKEALNARDLAQVLGLFTDDAVVQAPISGSSEVAEFHAYMFSTTKRTAASFGRVFHRRDFAACVTLPFSYTFSIPSGAVTVIDGAATFEMDQGSGKFKRLAVHYEASDLRRFMIEQDISPPYRVSW